jgi:hypothetical protein
LDESPVEKLRRWELSGATLRVLHLSATHAVVDLCACTGEPMERLSSDDPRVVHYLTARSETGGSTTADP